MPRWLPLLLFAAFVPSAQSAVPDADIIVAVRKDKETIFVDVDCPVRAPLAVIWEVLTDYDHMSGFISTLNYSGVEARSDNVLTVKQKGTAKLGLLSFEFENVREVEIVP